MKRIFKFTMFVALFVSLFVIALIIIEWTVSGNCRKHGNYSVYLYISSGKWQVIFNVNETYEFYINSITSKFVIHSDSFTLIGNFKKAVDNRYFPNRSVEKLLYVNITGDTVFKVENLLQALNDLKINDTTISYNIAGDIGKYTDSIISSHATNHNNTCKVDVYVDGTVCCSKRSVIQLLKCLTAKCYVKINRKCQELYTVEEPIKLKCLHYW